MATTTHPEDSAATAAVFRWDRLTVAAALTYCLLVAGVSVGVVLSELRDEFHLPGWLAALHGSTFGIGLLIVGFFGVGLIDRIGRRNAMTGAAGAIALGVAMFSLGGNWPVTLAGTALSGLGAAMIVMAMPGLISDHHGPHRAAAFAAANSAPGVAAVAFSLAIGAALGARWSWRPIYLGLTAITIIAVAIVAKPVTIPRPTSHGSFHLGQFRDRHRVLIPWLFIVNAVLTEYSIGIWSTSYLKEVGGASSGMAPVLAATFGVMMFVSRVVLPTTQRVLGEATISVSFVAVGAGAAVMCFGPGLTIKVFGLAVTAFGGGPLYPLTVDRLYQRAQGAVDSTSLGAISALASGAAVTIGPLVLGLLADGIGLRWAILFVPMLCVLGAVTQRPLSTDM